MKRHYKQEPLHIYSSKNFFPYLMWDITNTPPCRHNVLVVSYGIAGPNRQTPHSGSNKSSHQGQGSTLIPFVMTHTQPCKYCLL